MNHQRWMSQNFFVFFFTWGIFLPYWTGWLVSAKELDVSEASIIMGAGLLIRGVSTMFAYPFISKFMSQKKVLLGFTIGSLIAILFYIPSSSFVSLFAVTVLFSAIYPSLLPAVEGAAGTLVQREGIHYGNSRSYGSLGFIISVLVISIVTGYFGDQAILWTMMVGLVLLLLLGLLPAPAVLMEQSSQQERRNSQSMRSLWQNKTFPIVLLVIILLQGAHSSYYNYGFIYLQDLGVNSYFIGIILNIAVLFEIIYFARADHIFINWKPSSLLMIAAIGSTVRWLLIFLFPNIWVFIISQSLHALSFGVAHFAFIAYITKNLPLQQISNAQGLYSALAMSFSTAILTFVGGFLYEILPGLAFLGMVVFTIPAFLLLIGTRKKYNY